MWFLGNSHIICYQFICEKARACLWWSRLRLLSIQPCCKAPRLLLHLLLCVWSTPMRTDFCRRRLLARLKSIVFLSQKVFRKMSRHWKRKKKRSHPSTLMMTRTSYLRCKKAEEIILLPSQTLNSWLTVCTERFWPHKKRVVWQCSFWF